MNNRNERTNLIQIKSNQTKYQIHGKPITQDARNIARIVVELARTPIRLEANTFIHPNRKWWWMTKDGTVDFPEYVAPYSGIEYGGDGYGSISGSGSVSGASSVGSGGTFFSPPLSPTVMTAPPSPMLSMR